MSHPRSRGSADAEMATKVAAGIAGVVGALGLAAGLGLLIDKAMQDSPRHVQPIALKSAPVQRALPPPDKWPDCVAPPPPYSFPVRDHGSVEVEAEEDSPTEGRTTKRGRARNKKQNKEKKSQLHEEDETDRAEARPLTTKGKAGRALGSEGSPLQDCTHFLHRRCRYGDGCKFRHHEGITVDTPHCRKWPQCAKPSCRFQHAKQSSPHLNPSARAETMTTSTSSSLSVTGPTPSVTPPPPPPSVSSSAHQSVSYYWDVENCPIPRRVDAFAVVQSVRQLIGETSACMERSFKAYCDPSTLSSEHRLALHEANVEVMDVPDRKPGAADRKLQLDLDRMTGGAGGMRGHTIVLISGDVDFIQKLNDLRYQQGCTVVLIHNAQAKANLRATAHRAYEWTTFIAGKKKAKDERKQREPATPKHKSRPSGEVHPRSRPPPPSAVANEGFVCKHCSSVFSAKVGLLQHKEAKHPRTACSYH